MEELLDLTPDERIMMLAHGHNFIDATQGERAMAALQAAQEGDMERFRELVQTMGSSLLSPAIVRRLYNRINNPAGQRGKLLTRDQVSNILFAFDITRLMERAASMTGLGQKSDEARLAAQARAAAAEEDAREAMAEASRASGGAAVIREGLARNTSRDMAPGDQVALALRR
jgi:hypothetical protein